MAKLSAVAVYTAGFLQGCAFVLIPALGTILTAAPYHLSSSSYGMLFLPQTLGAIFGALGADTLHRRIGSRGLFRTGVSANVIALLLLAGAAYSSGTMAHVLLLLETLFLGMGFGLTLAAVNHYAALLFPGKATMAVTLLNAAIGGATALSPLILHGIAGWTNWGMWPLALATGFGLVLFLPLPAGTSRSGESSGFERSMWLFALAVFLYAIGEGIFGSWANIYISVNKALPAHYGALALSAFWGSMTLFRILLALVPERIIAQRQLYLAAPIGMGICFAALPFLSGAWTLIAAFALAGAACSVYFPFSMSYGLAAFSGQQTRMAGLLVAALMAGEGIGSFALGPLQGLVTLAHIYLFATLLAVPLFGLGWRLSARATNS
ncbi:MAG: MFS transporter [Pseudomonadota bacterium]